MHRSVLSIATFLPAILVVAFLLIWNIRRRPAYGKQPHAPLRTASLTATTGTGNSWWVGLLSTLLLLGGTASLLASRWRTIPRRFPIHWGIDGLPNGWTDRSFASIFGVLLFAFVLVVSFGLFGELMGRSSPGHEGRPAMIRTSRRILVACAWFVTILLCSISLLPLTHDPTTLVPFLLLGCAVFSVGILAYIAYRSTRMAQVIDAGQNSTDSRFWKAGLFYFNPGDSALMVPKRVGFGYTLNFGQPLCWLMFGVILLIALILPLVMHVSSSR